MILDGKKIKSIILDEVRREVQNLDVKLKLVIIQIGMDDASNIYLNQKKMMCDYVGYEYEVINLDNNVQNDEVVSLIDSLNKDSSVTGIMVQLPIPNHLNKDLILNKIEPCKDVDGLTIDNMNNLMMGRDGLFSPTALGIVELLRSYNIDVKDKRVVVVGRSNLVGRPVSIMFKNLGAMVTVCHSDTDDLAKCTIDADIIISAVGKINLITSDMISTGSVVVDVGINRKDNCICGDVDYDGVISKVSYITPVPGGVGPMTVAMLARNVLNAYKFQKR